MEKCYNCETDLTELTKSSEHIIPNSIGGKIKSVKLLCRDCNTLFGETIDGEFSKSYENIVSLLGLKRDRSKNYTIKNLKAQDGTLYHLLDGFTPTPSKPVIKIKGDKLSITARDLDQLKQIIKGQQRKYPNLDIKDFEHTNQIQDDYLKQKLSIKITLGGDQVFRAIAKIAVNYLISSKFDKNILLSIIKIINGSNSNDQHIHHYPLSETFDSDIDQVLHMVQIRGCSRKKILYAHIVLFSFSSFIVNLSDDYDGKDFQKNYCYDVISQSVIEKTINVDYPGRIKYKELLLTNNEPVHHANIHSIQTWLSRLSVTIDNLHAEKSMDKILTECMEEVKIKYSGMKTFSREMMDDYIERVSFRMAVLIEHIHNRKA